jgi:radical SAM additional 4Fe4S-binding domain
MARDKNFFGDYLQTFDGYDLDFFGGECLTYSKFVREITDYMAKRCEELGIFDKLYKIQIETNGTIWNSDLEYLIAKYGKKIELPITLDGCKECHDACRKFRNGEGSYDMVEKNVVRHFKELERQPNTKFSIAPENLDYYVDSIKNFIRLGYKKIRECYVYENVWIPKLIEKYEQKLTESREWMVETGNHLFTNWTNPEAFSHKVGLEGPTCGADGSMIALDWKGNLFSCTRFSDVAISDRELFAIGNIERGITRRDKVNMLRDSIRYDEKRCVDCPINYGCMWCAAYNYQYSGNVNHSSKPWCELHKATARVMKWYIPEYQKWLIQNQERIEKGA